MSHIPTEGELRHEFDDLSSNEVLKSFSNWVQPNTGTVFGSNLHSQFAECAAEEFFEAADSALG